jgi:hypothetical protein
MLITQPFVIEADSHPRNRIATRAVAHRDALLIAGVARPTEQQPQDPHLETHDSANSKLCAERHLPSS